MILYDSGADAADGMERKEIAYKTSVKIKRHMGGRQWVFEYFAGSKYFVDLQSGLPWVLLLVGLLLASLVGGVLAIISAQSFRLNELVKERTRELREEINQGIERQRKLEELNEDIVRSNRDLEEFAYVASHDLQEPLRKVEAFGELVAAGAGDSLPEQERDYLDRMLKSVQRMRGLIQSLLTYSRLATNAKPFQKVDLSAVLRGVEQDLEMRINELSAEIKSDDLPEVFGDREQLTILLQNLVNNALKFHSKQHPRIVISHKIDANAKKIVVSVADNGIGINPKFEDRIFILFQRLHSRSEYEGTGIGLALCRRIVERHGGRIWVESEEGEGAVFHFELSLETVSSGIVPV